MFGAERTLQLGEMQTLIKCQHSSTAIDFSQFVRITTCLDDGLEHKDLKKDLNDINNLQSIGGQFVWPWREGEIRLASQQQSQAGGPEDRYVSFGPSAGWHSISDADTNRPIFLVCNIPFTCYQFKYSMNETTSSE